MSSIVDCPLCSKRLRLPDELLGQKVKCPACAGTFDPAPAEAAREPVPPRAEDGRQEAAAPEPALRSPDRAETSDGPPEPAPNRNAWRVPARDDDAEPTAGHEDEPCPECGAPVSAHAERCRHCGAPLDEDEDEPRRRGVRRDSEPHRGTLVMVLGIASLVTAVTCFLSPVGLILGLFAWIMGQGDLRKIRDQAMDPQGQATTQAGWICGIIGTCLGGLASLGCVGYFGSVFYLVSTIKPTPPPTAPPAVIMTTPAPVPAPAPPNPGVPQIRKWQMPGEVKVLDEDYVQARRRFRTNLRTQGGFPPPEHPFEPPPGVKELPYRSGNLPLKLWVSEPAGAGRRPAVVFLHDDKNFLREPWRDDWERSRPYRDAGFVVMTPMLRGENGLPGDYTMFYDEVDDVKAAAAELARLPYVDPKRVYLVGERSGATLAMLTAMTTNQFQTVIAICPRPYMSRGERDETPFQRGDWREFEVRSPLVYIKSLKCPVRLYYAKDDAYPENAYQMMTRAARAAGKELTMVPMAGLHFHMFPAALKDSVEFLRKKQ